MKAMRQTWITATILVGLFVPAVKAAKDSSAGDSASKAPGGFQMTAAQAMEAARKIDGFIAEGYTEHKLKPTSIINDQVFLRRAYLDIAGRNPTFDEARGFLNSTEGDKRRKLIDGLLNSEAYVANYFTFWSDLLRIKSNLSNQTPGAPYIEFVKDFIRTNKPYDQWVHQMLSAEGRILDNGASGYFLRDPGMPLDNMAVTTQIFLSTSITCAQCHDHPFDKWTQLEFYQLAAYTYGLEYREREGIVNQRELYAKLKDAKLPGNVDARIRNIIRVNSVGLNDSKKAIKLPDDYKYDDAKPGQLINPATPFGKEAKIDGVPRMSFAKWLTDRDNPRFALSISNRLWGKIMGKGLIDPVDEITDKSKPSHPELSKYLTKLMLDANFSVKDFIRILYFTDTYQRATLTADLGADDVYVFQGRQLKRLSAEQLWDSFVTLMNSTPDESGSSYDLDRYNNIDIKGKSADQVIAMLKSGTLADPKKALNGKKGAPAKNAKKGAKPADDDSMMGGGGYGAQFARASNRQLPASPGDPNCFLREFGQSDKEAINAYSSDPNVSQVLRLLNGPIDKLILDKRSDIMKRVEAAKGADKTYVIWMSILSRPPRQDESQMVSRMMSANGGAGNVIWALLNTREFMFCQ